MNWPRDLQIPWSALHNNLGGWFFAAAGIAAAVLLHRKDRKCRLWPVLPAVLLWLVCEVAGLNLRSYLLEILALAAGCFAFGYAVSWLVMDVVYLLKKKKTGPEEKKRTVTSSVILLFLAALLTVICLTRPTEYPPSHDLSSLVKVGLQDAKAPVFIGAKRYYYFTKMGANAFEALCTGLNIAVPAELGKVIAYGPKHPRSQYYYCTVDKLDGDWLLMFAEDGTGVPSAKNVVYLYCTGESRALAPDWLKKWER